MPENRYNTIIVGGGIAGLTSAAYLAREGKKILLIEDNEDIRSNTAEILELSNYKVITAENGKIGVEKAIEYKPDLIILDIRMPKVNGIEAIAYFRQNYPRVPLIVLTGFPDTDMATSMLRQGVVDYLVKPVEGEKLKASVARAMEQRELAHL